MGVAMPVVGVVFLWCLVASCVARGNDDVADAGVDGGTGGG